MGYTHYFYQKPELDIKRFNKFAGLCAEMLHTSEARRIICYELDCPDDYAETTEECVRFNGKGDDGYETFMLKRLTGIQAMRGETLAFSFCKTRNKPYDQYVIACLLIAKHVFGDDIRLSSDGKLTDWSDGMTLACRTLNIDAQLIDDPDTGIQLRAA